MKKDEWEEIKIKYPRGTLFSKKIIEHRAYGIFLDLEETDFLGFVPITEVGYSPMSMNEFPPVGKLVDVIVIGYTTDERNQVWFGIKQVKGHRSGKRDETLPL